MFSGGRQQRVLFHWDISNRANNLYSSPGFVNEINVNLCCESQLITFISGDKSYKFWLTCSIIATLYLFIIRRCLKWKLVFCLFAFWLCDIDQSITIFNENRPVKLSVVKVRSLKASWGYMMSSCSCRWNEEVVWGRERIFGDLWTSGRPSLCIVEECFEPAGKKHFN